MDGPRMTDKEMLMLAYGAIKASSFGYFKEVISVIEEHLWPAVVVNVEMPLKKDIENL